MLLAQIVGLPRDPRTEALVRAYQDQQRSREVGESTVPESKTVTPVVSSSPSSSHTDWKAKLSHLLEQ